MPHVNGPVCGASICFKRFLHPVVSAAAAFTPLLLQKLFQILSIFVIPTERIQCIRRNAPYALLQTSSFL
jgi:hypothetical protein